MGGREETNLTHKIFGRPGNLKNHNFYKNSGFYDMQFARTEDAEGFNLSIIQFPFLCNVQHFSTHVQKMIQRPFKLNSFIYTNR